MSSLDDWITEPHFVALHQHFHALGVLHARWNVAELHFQQLAWSLIGAGPTIGGAVTFSLGNIARADLILTLAREVMKHPDTVGLFEFFVKLFNRNRENRNFLFHRRLMHASNMPYGQYAIIQGFSAKGRTRLPMFVLPLSEVRAVADEVETMNVFFNRFLDILIADAGPEQLSSLERPPLPRTLVERLRSFDPTDLPPPESSQT